MMIWIILSVVVFVALFWYLMFDGFKPSKYPFSYYSIWETLFGSGGTAILVFLASILIMLVISMMWSEKPVEKKYSNEYDIVALQDNLGAAGNFFLGSGYIDNELSYTYMHYVEGCGYKAETVEASNAYVEFTDEQPYVSVVKYRFKDNWRNYITIPYNSEDIFFYVPEGSILQNYNIDLK